jgi:hypothetical protein
LDGYYVSQGDTLRHSSGEFHYTLLAVFADSTRLPLQTFAITPILPSNFGISGNFPNPFNGFTLLEVYLPFADKVVIRFFDLLGRGVPPSMTEEFNEGYHRIQLDFRKMASGTYIYRAESNGKSVTGKLMLVK